MKRRSFLHGILTAGASIVVAPASALDDLERDDRARARGRVHVDMGRVSPPLDMRVHAYVWVPSGANLWAANSSHGSFLLLI